MKAANVPGIKKVKSIQDALKHVSFEMGQLHALAVQQVKKRGRR